MSQFSKGFLQNTYKVPELENSVGKPDINKALLTKAPFVANILNWQ